MLASQALKELLCCCQHRNMLIFCAAASVYCPVYSKGEYGREEARNQAPACRYGDVHAAARHCTSSIAGPGAARLEHDWRVCLAGCKRALQSSVLIVMLLLLLSLQEVSGQVPARLVFRQQGLAEAWNDPGIRRAVVRGA